MKRFLPLLLVACSFFLFLPANAHANSVVPLFDSVPEESDQAPSMLDVIPLEEIDQAYFDAMDQFERDCEKDIGLSRYKDCRCMAVGYMDIILRYGLDAPRPQVMERLRYTCPAPEKVAGYYFQRCQSTEQINQNTQAGIDRYCTCYANGVANRFRETPNLNGRQLRQLEDAATAECRRAQADMR